jgi:hypothetical protein
MIRPRFFQAMRKQLHGLGPSGAKDEKASDGGTESTNDPDETFHCMFSLAYSQRPTRLDAGKGAASIWAMDIRQGDSFAD